MNKFWMVYGIGKTCAKFKHPTAESAVTEAQRLAAENPGDVFVVLEAIIECKTEFPPVITSKIPSAPYSVAEKNLP